MSFRAYIEMRAVYVRFFERSADSNADALDAARWVNRPASESIDALVALAVKA